MGSAAPVDVSKPRVASTRARGMLVRVNRWPIIALVALVTVAGCRSESPVTADLGPSSELDLAFERDLGAPCVSSEECDDGVDCTRDVCDRRGICVHTEDPLRCDDGVYCNGAERCDRVRGCVAGSLRACNDFDVCTLDRCDEQRGACVHTIRDFDGDGEADDRCAGGTDCDDADPQRGSLQTELCVDGVDNDCDGQVDEARCGRPPHDLCADALDVTGDGTGGRFTLSVDGARDDYGAACSGPTKELVARVDVAARSDLRVTAVGAGQTQIFLRRGCDTNALDVACDTGAPGEVRLRDVSPDTYFIFVGASSGDVQLEVAIEEPTSAPTNEACETATALDVPALVRESFVGTTDDLDIACGESGAKDLVYSFEVPEDGPRDVIIAVGGSEEGARFSVRVFCDVASTELVCARGAPAGARLRSLPPGIYALIVEGPAERDVDISLEVRFEAPTPRPPGDTCGDPIDTPLGTIVHGTLADKLDEIATLCGYFYPDAIHRFELTEARDVSIDLRAGDGGRDYVIGSISTACGGFGSCLGGAPVALDIPNLPAGTHYLRVEAPSSPSYQLRIDTSAPTPVVDAALNDTCAQAIEIPDSEAIVYRGSTRALNDDVGYAYCGSGTRSPDATFLLDLAETTDIRLSTAGSDFDTVLMIYAESRECRGYPTACDDDSGSGSTSLLERTLSPGRYHIVVDGFGSQSAGNYYLRVERLPPPAP